MNRSIFVALAACTVLTACGLADVTKRAEVSPLDPPAMGHATDNFNLAAPAVMEFEDLRMPLGKEQAESDMTRIRVMSLQRAGEAYGAEHGYKASVYKIMKALEQKTALLDQVYPFSRVVGETPYNAAYIIPPVVGRTESAVAINNDGKEATVVEEYLSILRPAELSMEPPSWRDYLFISAPDPQPVANSLMPKTPAEVAVFTHAARNGWAEAVKTADREITGRLDDLEHDFKGMLQYRRLVDMGMIDRVVLDDANLGVTTEENVMRIGSKVVTIVNGAEFQDNPQRWKVRSAGERDAMIVSRGGIPPLDFDFE